MKKPILLCIALLVGAFVSGCTDSAPSGPTPGLGSVTVTKYVAIGNSISAGYQSGALYKSAQDYSFPILLAKQLTKSSANLGSFEQPYFADPGTGGRLELKGFVDPLTPNIQPNAAKGSPTNIGLLRAYDNLGIPGATIYDFLNAVDSNTCAAKLSGGSNPLFTYILRTGGSQFKQAKSLNPDLITFWLGNNDVLGFATSGGTGPKAPTAFTTQFQPLYSFSLDSLKAAFPNAKVFVGNIPDIRALAFFNVMGPKLRDGIAGAKKTNSAIVGLFYQSHGDTLGKKFTNLDKSGDPLITYYAASYAPLLGDTLGKYYAAIGKTPLPGIDTKKPFGFHPQNPFPDALVLDSAEQATAATAIATFNGFIQTKVQSKGFFLVDFYSIFNSIKANGYSTGGEKYTADFLTGGLFSLDGVHPTSRGAGIIANEFIKSMNANLGMTVPLVDISSLPGIPMVLGKFAAGQKLAPSLPPGALDNLNALFSPGW